MFNSLNYLIMKKNKSDLLKLIAEVWGHLSKRRHKQFGLVLCLMLISSFAEVVSLGAVVPFLGVLVAPEQIFTHPLMVQVINMMGIESAKQLVLPVTILFVLLALIAGIIRITLLWVNARFAAASGTDLSVAVYENRLYQPYSVHVSKNSSEVISGVTNKVNSVIFGVIQPVLIFISAAVLLVSMLLVLIIVNPIVAVTAIIGFGLSYGFVVTLVRQRLKTNSLKISCEQTKVIKAVQEGLGGIRDVIIGDNQTFFCETYRKADYPLRMAQCNNLFIASSPRYILETLGIVLIVVLSYVISQEDGGIVSALPMLGAIVLGAQRVLPAMQQAYGAWASILGNQASLEDVIGFLDEPLKHSSAKNIFPLTFQDAIDFNNIRYRYAPNAPWTLDGINISFKKGTRVGIIGATGSGKSTLMDLFLGLLQPVEGTIAVDGRVINEHEITSWQKCISHVPQHIYLLDATIAENVAFGLKVGDIDMLRVKQAVLQTHLSDFVDTLPEGLNTIVGENGTRLSGGQKQRIGIARSLYNDVDILVLDEATSALDTETEFSVMETIENINRNITILIIAHRISTLQNCDKIIELKDGKIFTEGTYDEILLDDRRI